MADADLTITNSSGTPITNTYEIFSGTINVGSGVYSGKIRVYNNQDAASGVAHARDVKLFMSPVSGSIGYNMSIGDFHEDITSVGFALQTLSGSCVYSSKLQGAVSGTVQNLGVGIYGKTYDEISASGSHNYNEYDLTIELPSGTNLQVLSGSIYLAVEYKTFLV